MNARAPLRLLRVIGFTISNPAYVLGRFQSVRFLYAVARGLFQRFCARPEISLHSLYEADGEKLTIKPTPLVESATSPKAHVRALRNHAFSKDIRLSRKAVAHLVKAARNSPLQQAVGSDVENIDALMRSDFLGKTAFASVKNSGQIEAIQEIAGDTNVLAVVSGYLGYFPSVVSSWLFWSPRKWHDE